MFSFSVFVVFVKCVYVLFSLFNLAVFVIAACFDIFPNANFDLMFDPCPYAGLGI